VFSVLKEHNVNSRAEKKAVVLFGEVLVDVFPDKSVLGGAPFNVARHLQAFGLPPLLITRTGNDEVREQLLSAMEQYGMDVSGVQSDPSHPSGQVKVHIEGKQHQFEILPDRAYDYIQADTARAISSAARPQLLYFGTLAQRSSVSSQALSALLGIDSLKFLDINLRKPWYDLSTLERSLDSADIVKMNEDELSEVAVMLRLSGKTSEECADELIRQFKLERLLVTCGEQGAWQMDKSGKIIHIRGKALENPLVDTVGAGDGFAAVLIAGILNEWPAEMILSRANNFAAAICRIRGAIPANQDFYAPFLEEWKNAV
jgi:fructokinase